MKNTEEQAHELWQKGMYEKYPVIFGDHDKPMSQTCMCWGISIGRGWHKIIEDLCESLQGILKQHDIKVIADQVKEKFGTLRFYYHVDYPDGIAQEGVSKLYDEIRELVNKAEDKSAETCEVCGDKGTQRSGGWICTLCEKHAKERT
jgi:hypothetical protein